MLLAAVILGAWGVISGRNHNPPKAAAGEPLPPDATSVDPSEFPRGACVALAPTSGDRRETVFLDAGHGGVDPGGVGTTQSGTTIYEADETLRVELDAADLLRAQGFRVVVSRTTSTTVVEPTSAEVSGGELTVKGSHDDVAARDICADDAGAKALVGIYFDAAKSESAAGSVTAYDADRPFSQQSLELANRVQSDVFADMNAKGWQIPDDGVVGDGQLGSYVGPDSSDAGAQIASAAASYPHLMLLGPPMAGFFTTPSEMPGAVVEPLYITDPFEGSIADSSTGQQTIADGIAQAVEQFLGAGR